MHLVGGTERNPRDRRRTRETRAEGYNEHEISQIPIARASAPPPACHGASASCHLCCVQFYSALDLLGGPPRRDRLP
jgi:hypothetical protein